MKHTHTHTHTHTQRQHSGENKFQRNEFIIWNHLPVKDLAFHAEEDGSL